MALNTSRGAIIIDKLLTNYRQQYLSDKSLSLTVPLTVMLVQAFDCRTKVSLTIGTAGPVSGTWIDMQSMFLTAWNPGTRCTWPQPISRSVRFEDSVSWQCLFFQQAHENNSERLILITAGWGQILSCVGSFYYTMFEELPVLSQTSRGMKGVLRKEHICRWLFSCCP